jgi:NADH-quinone oxidoreductase subunit L
MKAAMGLLAVGAVFAGALQIPHVTEVLHHFLEPTFADSRYFEQLEPSDTLTFGGLGLGALLGIAGVALAYLIWVRRPGTAERVRERFRPAYTLFSNKWYGDEAIEAVIVRPSLWFGRFAQSTFERVVVNGLFVGGPVGLIRAGSAAVRARQTGFLRAYAALMLVGIAGALLWFLLEAS